LWLKSKIWGNRTVQLCYVLFVVLKMFVFVATLNRFVLQLLAFFISIVPPSWRNFNFDQKQKSYANWKLCNAEKSKIMPPPLVLNVQIRRLCPEMNQWLDKNKFYVKTKTFQKNTLWILIMNIVFEFWFINICSILC
jgi:hypothetical protein